jgi:hypothetical protein
MATNDGCDLSTNSLNFCHTPSCSAPLQEIAQNRRLVIDDGGGSVRNEPFAPRTKRPARTTR